MEPNRAAAVPDAIETLIAELEREHAWLTDLRADLARVEARCGHLMNAADSALSALDRAERRPFLERLRRLQIETRTLGRPPIDGRRDAVLSYLAEKRHGAVTNAEIRRHLTALGLNGTPGYAGQMLSSLTQDGMLHRLGHGEYTIAHDNRRLRDLRFRLDRSAAIEEERIRRRAERRIEEDSTGERNEIKRLKQTTDPPDGAMTDRERQRIAQAYPNGQPDWTQQTDENGLYDPGW